MRDDFQYYPTPISLAQKAINLFKSKNISRILEPSAGTGSLIKPLLDSKSYAGVCHIKWDAIELNPKHHATLRELGAKVIGFDFLAQDNCAIYSHILLNPPFAQGANHVLHAWDLLYDGEIVAILNAETIKNPYSKERQRLLTIIANNGSVEFIENAFEGIGVEREANVEVALVYLRKKAESSAVFEKILNSLDKDEGVSSNQDSWEAPSDLVIPQNAIENAVTNYNAAVSAAMEVSQAIARADYFKARVGNTLTQVQAEDKLNSPPELLDEAIAAKVKRLFAERLEELKDCAWTYLLHSTNVTNRLSSKTYDRVVSEFEDIKALSFTVSNIYGFLEGLAASGNELQLEMMCEVFDSFTRYGTDNSAFYMGWKSNDAHKTAGRRLKYTRFITPGDSDTSWRSTASVELCRRLADYDKVFAMLDGNVNPETPLAPLFETQESFTRLKDGERMLSSYFEVRFYQGVGSIHFFPTRPDLVDRLNRIVGQHRGWLPQEWEQAAPDFKKHYDMAEKFQAKALAAFKRNAKGNNEYQRSRMLHDLESNNAENKALAHNLMFDAIEAEVRARGLEPFTAIGHERNDALLLKSA